MQNPKGIALDLEGTLVNLEPEHHASHLAVAARLGLHLDHARARRLIPGFVGGGDRRVAQGIYELAGCQVSTDWILQDIRAEFRGRVAGIRTIPLRNGAIPFLEQAFARGIPLAIGSLTPTPDAIELLHKADLHRFFPRENCVLAEDVLNLKPSPDVYLETARRLRIEPTNQLIFEDSEPGVLAGVAAGSTVIAVPTIHDESFLNCLRVAGAERVIREWTELSFADVANLGGSHR